MRKRQTKEDFEKRIFESPQPGDTPEKQHQDISDSPDLTPAEKHKLQKDVLREAERRGKKPNSPLFPK